MNRFNTRFGAIFAMPEPLILKEIARIYDIQNPASKMSKSAESAAGAVWLLGEPSVTAKKIKSAVMDAGREVCYDVAEKPGVSNLLIIFAVLSDRSIFFTEVVYQGRGYGDFKKDLADVVVETFAPIRERTRELLGDPGELDRVLASNADRAAATANVALASAYDRIGLLPKGWRCPRRSFERNGCGSIRRCSPIDSRSQSTAEIRSLKH